jgi:hypothetical protein
MEGPLIEDANTLVMEFMIDLHPEYTGCIQHDHFSDEGKVRKYTVRGIVVQLTYKATSRRRMGTISSCLIVGNKVSIVVTYVDDVLLTAEKHETS